MTPPRCGNCGRFGGVRYEWRGPSYCEVFHCEHCGSKGYKYDPFAAAVAEMSAEEIKEELL